MAVDWPRTLIREGWPIFGTGGSLDSGETEPDNLKVELQRLELTLQRVRRGGGKNPRPFCGILFPAPLG